MRDGAFAIHGVGAGPEKQIAGAQAVQLRGVQIAALHGLKSAVGFRPGVLFIRGTRHILHSGLLEQKKDRARTIHSFLRWIGGAVKISEVSFGQGQRRIQKILYGGRVVIESREGR